MKRQYIKPNLYIRRVNFTGPLTLSKENSTNYTGNETLSQPETDGTVGGEKDIQNGFVDGAKGSSWSDWED